MKEAYYFSHDQNARRDPKILAMRSDYGSEGYGRYWMIIEMLSEQEDYKLKHAKWVTNAIAMELLCDANSAEQFLNDCVNEYELLQSDGEFFWSDSLIRRMEVKEEKRQKKVEAGKKGAEKRWHNSDSEGKGKESDGSAIADDGGAIAQDGKGKESKGKESKRKYRDYVYLTDTEYGRLVKDYGEELTNKKIRDLDDYIAMKKPGYKDHNRAIRNFIRRDQEDGVLPKDLKEQKTDKPKTEKEVLENRYREVQEELNKGYDYFFDRAITDHWDDLKQEAAEIEQQLRSN
ncbi:Lin1244/Lin1753 domain-containing protein [Salibacterium lacus]|uniref:Lin1244/Lin1753 domain-containing protein n=1 Tax=Salibacterium lacus TaxID=1898109 RepID=A0ABW5SZY6_9BACI